MFYLRLLSDKPTLVLLSNGRPFYIFNNAIPFEIYSLKKKKKIIKRILYQILLFFVTFV